MKKLEEPIKYRYYFIIKLKNGITIEQKTSYKMAKIMLKEIMLEKSKAICAGIIKEKIID